MSRTDPWTTTQDYYLSEAFQVHGTDWQKVASTFSQTSIRFATPMDCKGRCIQLKIQKTHKLSLTKQSVSNSNSSSSSSSASSSSSSSNSSSSSSSVSLGTNKRKSKSQSVVASTKYHHDHVANDQEEEESKSKSLTAPSREVQKLTTSYHTAGHHFEAFANPQKLEGRKRKKSSNNSYSSDTKVSDSPPPPPKPSLASLTKKRKQEHQLSGQNGPLSPSSAADALTTIDGFTINEFGISPSPTSKKLLANEKEKKKEKGKELNNSLQATKTSTTTTTTTTIKTKTSKKKHVKEKTIIWQSNKRQGMLNCEISQLVQEEGWNINMEDASFSIQKNDLIKLGWYILSKERKKKRRRTQVMLDRLFISPDHQVFRSKISAVQYNATLSTTTTASTLSTTTASTLSTTTMPLLRGGRAARRIHTSVPVVSKRPRGIITMDCNSIEHSDPMLAQPPLQCIHEEGFAFISMSHDHKSILQNATTMLENVSNTCKLFLLFSQ